MALAALACLAAGVEGAAAQSVLIVRIYDAAPPADAINPHASLAARTNAVRISRAILEQAGLVTEWRDCGRGGADYPCAERGPGEIVVRILPAAVADPDSPSALVSTHGAGAKAHRLGFAAVDTNGRTGILATVYRDNVRRAARRGRLSYSELLGRAIAHEIGHLLLGGASHSTAGLMRAVWTDAELIRNRPADWLFSPAERERLSVLLNPDSTY